MALRVPTRVPWSLEPTPFALKVDAARRAGGPLLDLTVSNPARAGLAPDPAAVTAALADPAGVVYDPTPVGLPAAVAAVRRYYTDHGADLDGSRVLLTASTSEAYTWLFKVLCEPGEPVAVPRPSYPLFEFLTGLEGARTLPYELLYDGAWHLDLDGVARALDAGARAVLVVHPSNPVGATLDDATRARLVALCADKGAALIVDEVFLDYAAAARTVAGEAGCLTFVLSGLSKVCALPGLKCAWIVASGPDSDAAADRLELVADTFLSVNTPVQAALPALLGGRAAVQDVLRARLAENLAALDAARPAGAPWDRVTGADGWYAVLRVPATRSDEAWAEALLADGVVVHPGHLYDLPGTHLVLSRLPQPAVFAEGVRRLAARLGA